MIVVHCGFESQLHTLGYSQSTLGKNKFSHTLKHNWWYLWSTMIDKLYWKWLYLLPAFNINVIIYISLLFTNTQNLLDTCVCLCVISQCLHWQSTTIATAQYNDKRGKFFVTLNSWQSHRQKLQDLEGTHECQPSVSRLYERALGIFTDEAKGQRAFSCSDSK